MSVTVFAAIIWAPKRARGVLCPASNLAVHFPTTSRTPCVIEENLADQDPRLNKACREDIQIDKASYLTKVCPRKEVTMMSNATFHILGRQPKFSSVHLVT